LQNKVENSLFAPAFIHNKKSKMEDHTLMDNTFGDMRLSDRMKSIISDIAKWTKFLSIVGFVFIGLLVIFAFYAGSYFEMYSALMGTSGMGTMMTVTYLILAIINFFPVLYLFQFASRAQKALANGNDTEIEIAFDSLRKHYLYLGILTIIILGLYAILFLIGSAM